MDSTTWAAVGTFIGSAAAAFTAQAWGNRKTEQSAESIAKSTASQTTSDEIRKDVKELKAEVELLKKSICGDNFVDHRGPKKGE